MFFFPTHDNSQATSELNGNKDMFSFDEFMVLQLRNTEQATS